MKKLVAGLLCLAMSLGLLAGAAFAKEEKTITADDLVITKTEIEAESVYNTDGYGCIRKNLNGPTEDSEEYVSCALIDRDGKYVFPYTETYQTYYVSGKYISLVLDNPNMLAQKPDEDYLTPKYYKITDGKTEELPTKLYTGTKMINGQAIGYDRLEDAWQGGNAHVVDEKNQTVCKLPEEFDQLGGFGGGYAGGFHLAAFHTKYSIECTDGELIGCTLRDGSGCIVSVLYTDYQGNVVLDLPENTGISNFSEGLATVYSDGGWGYIDKNGKVVIEYQYKSAGIFNDGLASVSKAGEGAGYINASGEVVIPLAYDSAFGAADGLASVGKDSKYGLVDYNNKVVVPLEYDDISTFKGGVAYAIKDGKVVIITLKESDPVCETHSWDKGVVTTEATCKAEGVKTYTCTVCGETKTEVIPKTDHVFGDWEVSKQATAVKDGEEVRICQNCAEKETRTVKAAGQIFSDVKDSNAWFYEKVYEIAAITNKKGTPLMSGYKNGNFGPTDPLTRQDFALILYRLADEPDVELPERQQGYILNKKSGVFHNVDCGHVKTMSEKNKILTSNTYDELVAKGYKPCSAATKNLFPDADPDGYYYEAIIWAQQEGVITGYDDGNFGVGHNITREQVATILYRYAKSVGIDTSVKGDLSKFSDVGKISDFAKDALVWANGAGIITGKKDGTIDPQGNAARAEIAKMLVVFMDVGEK